MQLMEIEDPVADQAGYVYERYNVEKYITENRGSVECPVSGKALKCYLYAPVQDMQCSRHALFRHALFMTCIVQDMHCSAVFE